MAKYQESWKQSHYKICLTANRKYSPNENTSKRTNIISPKYTTKLMLNPSLILCHPHHCTAHPVPKKHQARGKSNRCHMPKTINSILLMQLALFHFQFNNEIRGNYIQNIFKTLFNTVRVFQDVPSPHVSKLTRSIKLWFIAH